MWHILDICYPRLLQCHGGNTVILRANVTDMFNLLILNHTGMNECSQDNRFTLNRSLNCQYPLCDLSSTDRAAVLFTVVFVNSSIYVIGIFCNSLIFGLQQLNPVYDICLRLHCYCSPCCQQRSGPNHTL